MEGILPVYKPVGMTSYDVLRIFKKNNPPPDCQKRWKIGHGGTLDPFAEGVLLILLGRGGTKQFDTLRKLKKTYEATAVLGYSSDTLDCDGVIVEDINYKEPSEDDIRKVIPNFVGDILQEVPKYSAAKVNGKARYLYAREGKDIPAASKMVTIYDLDIMSFNPPEVVFRSTVSSGTYIRQLSFDILNKIGVKSYLKKLKRSEVGEFSCEKACSISEIENRMWEKYLISKT